ncbi:formyltetrahydrofolate deformylase [Burkholderia sp. Bp9126]|nr:formyltetrahydrofolate deformylase [Burkholderia sp. Bp9126]
MKTSESLIDVGAPDAGRPSPDGAEAARLLARLRDPAPAGAANREYVLRLSCRDSRGVVYAVSRALFEAGCNIVDAQQFGDVGSERVHGRFFMRVHVDAPAAVADATTLVRLLDGLRIAYGMDVEVHDAQWRPRVAILASREGHCLNDLIFRQMSGQLPIDIVAIVSNHAELGALAARFALPFHHLPMSDADGGKPAQEARIAELLERERVELVVLARYMQILSPEMCARLHGRAINIHHSFLPSFKGAQPYYQAFDRGVKLIGATAHYVTTDLDEGPIIEQDVERVDHAAGPRELAAIGRDIESVVLARAVKWHCEHRVLMNDGKTVVFR